MSISYSEQAINRIILVERCTLNQHLALAAEASRRSAGAISSRNGYIFALNLAEPTTWAIDASERGL